MERKIITLHYPKKKNYATNNMKGTHTHKKENKRDKKSHSPSFLLLKLFLFMTNHHSITIVEVSNYKQHHL